MFFHDAKYTTKRCIICLTSQFFILKLRRCITFSVYSVITLCTQDCILVIITVFITDRTWIFSSCTFPWSFPLICGFQFRNRNFYLINKINIKIIKLRDLQNCHWIRQFRKFRKFRIVNKDKKQKSKTLNI